MDIQSNDPVQDTHFPASNTSDAWVTHLLAIGLIVALVAGELFKEQPWDSRFALGFGLLTLISIVVLYKHKLIYQSIIIGAVLLGIVSMFHSDEVVLRYTAWSAFALILWAICMESLRGSPGVTDAPLSALFATIAAVAIGALLTNWLHLQLWSTLSICVFAGVTIFSTITFEL